MTAWGDDDTQKLVMPGLVPGIHVLLSGARERKVVDGRVKPGHDDNCYSLRASALGTPQFAARFGGVDGHDLTSVS
jgi:hypothetical protein